MSERLRQILQAQGIEAPDIHAVYIMKIGGILIKFPQVSSFTDNDPDEEAQVWKHYLSNAYNEIIAALKKHPNIFEVKPLGDKYETNGTYTKEGLILNVNPVKLHINLPTAVQKYSDEPWITNPDESFDIITTGSIFSAYMQVNDWPYFTNIAHEFRELFGKHINSSMKYEIPKFGPTPIHPNFYIILLEELTLPYNFPHIFNVDNDIFILVYNVFDIDEIVLDITLSMKFSLSLFYESIVEHGQLIDLTENIHNRFNNLISLFQQHQETKWYDLIKRINIDRQTSSQISHIYSSIFTAQAAQFNYDQSRKSVQTHVTASPFLAKTVKYFVDGLGDVLVARDSLFPALEHFAEHVRSVTGTRIAVIASIIGAAAGAILTAILTR